MIFSIYLLKLMNLRGENRWGIMVKYKDLQSKLSQQVFNSQHIAIMLINSQHKIDIVNPYCIELFGYTMDEVLQQDVSIIHLSMESREKFAKAIEADMSAYGHVSIVYPFKHKNGSVLWLKAFGEALGEDIFLWTAIDITHEKLLELTLEEQKNQLDYYANHDVLTSLPNRMYFQRYLDVLIGKYSISNNKLALFFLDLDRFKQINDSLGHEIGDHVLIEVASRIKSLVEDDDVVARLGGDEFTIIVQNVDNDIKISALANELIALLSTPICINNQMLYLSCSIGISIYPDDATNYKDLLKYADAAMYKAKEEGRNNFQFYQNEMTQIAFERVIMEAHLREALKNDDFVVYYQPQIDTKSENLVGMEALVRWEHKNLGIVPPSKFISLAEATGLIVDLDRFVMRSAIKQFALWYKNGYKPGKLSLNLTVQQIHQTDFIVELKDMIKDVDFKLEWLTLEVTESQIMKHPDETIKILKQISSMGISLAIDDFGVAYSSLSQLKKLPLDILKIDQSFIRGLPENEQDISIAKAIIALANSLDFKVLAEGVEDKSQRDFLLQEGCDEIQGYYYSRPITAKEIEDQFLKENV